ncbi:MULTISPECIES: restriction endonuclease [Paractinoplanes]|uniref:Restriction endonuclease type IV Mrr domain-containing protein n=1 Tax=Paractinoplanes toevensis TaxID=571911 RepID=A0A919TFB0_9ACTN|nr:MULTISPECIES: restriction endonuclease [Actinoplanes]GIM92981.1 hypothetical protein Ato02nite_047740 [Actinoplanes toevensis]
MVRYSASREWTLGLHALIARYGQLANAARGAEHRRGQQFNTLVADLLRHWGVDDVEVGVRGLDGVDEIDVTFRIGPTRYLLEAKWLAKPQSSDAIVKLAGRVRQRLRGTRGIVLSMSGYTRHAAKTAQIGQQPDVIMLDRSHFEAILSGLLPPEDLIEEVITNVARHGGVHVPLTDLVLQRRPGPPPAFTIPPDETVQDQLIREMAGGVSARAILIGGPGWPEPEALSIHPDRHTLLVTTGDGIVAVDIRHGTTQWALPLPGCRGTAIVEPDGALLTVCNNAVVRWQAEKLEVIGGGFTGNSSLLSGPDGPAWVFDNTGTMYDNLVSLTGLGAGLGAEDRHQIDFSANVWNATWLERRRFFLAADGHSAVVDLDVSNHVDRSAWVESPQSGPRPLITRDAKSIITAAYDQGVRGSLYQTSTTSGRSAQLAHLTVNRVHGMAIRDDRDAYLLADIRGNDPSPHPIVISVAGMGPFVSPQTRRSLAGPAPSDDTRDRQSS